ncbi:MAG TPA: xylanase/chitin deacetylase [Lactococcus sp.]|nr:xylanase/chitin deacetylase [Lactococcus sp.]
MKRKDRRKKKSMTKILLLLLVLIIGGIVYVFLNQKQADKKAENSVANIASKEKNTVSKNSSEKKVLLSKDENHLPILMYHYVTSNSDELPQDSNNIDIVAFENQLKALKENNYKTVSAAEAQQLLTKKEKLDNKLVWLTFDDGSVTMYTRIFPLLKKYNMHATSFIITDYVNNGQGGILTWDQIKEMKESGLVDFGSHTAQHFDLGLQTAEQQQEELLKSKSDLDKELNQNTDMICYPAGGYNQDTLNIADKLGYKFGVLDPGRNGAIESDAKESDGLLMLPRYRMLDTTTPNDLLKMLEQSTVYNTENTIEK